MDDIVKSAIGEVEKILKDKKNKGAAVGATLGYILSKDNKERNAIIGGLAGYFLGSKSEENKKTDGEK